MGCLNSKEAAAADQKDNKKGTNPDPQPPAAAADKAKGTANEAGKQSAKEAKTEAPAAADKAGSAASPSGQAAGAPSADGTGVPAPVNLPSLQEAEKIQEELERLQQASNAGGQDASAGAGAPGSEAAGISAADVLLLAPDDGALGSGSPGAASLTAAPGSVGRDTVADSDVGGGLASTAGLSSEPFTPPLSLSPASGATVGGSPSPERGNAAAAAAAAGAAAAAATSSPARPNAAAQLQPPASPVPSPPPSSPAKSAGRSSPAGTPKAASPAATAGAKGAEEPAGPRSAGGGAPVVRKAAVVDFTPAQHTASRPRARPDDQPRPASPTVISPAAVFRRSPGPNAPQQPPQRAPSPQPQRDAPAPAVFARLTAPSPTRSRSPAPATAPASRPASRAEGRPESRAGTAPPSSPPMSYAAALGLRDRANPLAQTAKAASGAAPPAAAAPLAATAPARVNGGSGPASHGGGGGANARGPIHPPGAPPPAWGLPPAHNPRMEVPSPPPAPPGASRWESPARSAPQGPASLGRASGPPSTTGRPQPLSYAAVAAAPPPAGAQKRPASALGTRSGSPAPRGAASYERAILTGATSVVTPQRLMDRTSPSPARNFVRGMPNTVSKYKEDRAVPVHGTPFEERLEKKLRARTPESP